ncbi:MAG: putative amidohydrolase, ThiJ/PfpI family [Firmicutes bacterium]|nr:putative amidohydrolase, ThiJ/PfpI family [Bacillota bacterium]
MKTVYIYLQDSLADWEAGYAIAELHSGRFFKKTAHPLIVRSCALSMKPITTMGGLKIMPELLVDEICLSEAALLILPGSNTWLEPQHEPLIDKAAAFLAAGIPVAAICGATFALGRAGLLNQQKHTSNDLAFLRQVSGDAYTGERLYQQMVAVRDGNLITASGTAPLEFAYQILELLGVFESDTLDFWYKLYKEKQPEYFFQLMESLNAGK